MELGVNIIVDSILDVNEVKSLMKLQITTQVYWVDPRLTYTNLFKNKLNVITTEQKERLWLPSLIVDTTKDKEEISFNDESTLGKINLKKDFDVKTAEWEVVQNYRKYAGYEGYCFLISIFFYFLIHG